MKKNLLFGFAAALTLASCTTNDDVLEVSSQRDLSFSTFVDKATKATGNQTSLEWDRSTFGVWGYYVPQDAWSTPSNVFNESGNVTIVTRGTTEGSWSYGNTPAKWIPLQNYRFYAYAPVNETIDARVEPSSNTMTITDFQVQGTATGGVIPYSPESQIDLMVANRYDRDNRNSFNNGSIDLNFKHILTNVNLEFKSTSKYDIVLTKVELKNVNTKGSASVEPGVASNEAHPMSIDWSSTSTPLTFAGALNSEEKPLTSTKVDNGVNTFGESFTSMENMLMIPQTIADLVLDIEYTVGGAGENGASTFERSINLSNGNETNTWSAGTRITYTITINTANGSGDQLYDIVFGTTSTTDWADGTNGSGSTTDKK